MPIEFQCDCGKELVVGDEFAGRRARCPECQAVVLVPAAAPDEDFLEVESKPKSRRIADEEDDRPRRRRSRQEEVDEDEEDDRPRRRRSRQEEDDEDEEDERPRRRRSRQEEDDEDEEDDRPRRGRSGRPASKYRKLAEKQNQKSGKSIESSAFNGGVVGGLVAMLIAVIWFVVGFVWLDRIFFYPPILFIIGLVGLIKGLVSGDDSDD